MATAMVFVGNPCFCRNGSEEYQVTNGAFKITIDGSGEPVPTEAP
jgi:hypothetical protein